MFSHFYFSCKNYQELAQARITKVVEFFTTNPTKLGLHFSDLSTIFYGFYKILQNTNTIEVTALQSAPWIFCRFTNMPLPCTKHPGISWGFAMWPLEGRPAWLRPNSGQPAAGVDRARAGGGCEVA
jgi:hypothetical protein